MIQMYTVYLQKTTVESRDRVVHHLRFHLKKPAVWLSQFQLCLRPLHTPYIKLCIPTVKICHRWSAQGCCIGIGSRISLTNAGTVEKIEPKLRGWAKFLGMAERMFRGISHPKKTYVTDRLGNPLFSPYPSKFFVVKNSPTKRGHVYNPKC